MGITYKMVLELPLASTPCPLDKNLSTFRSFDKLRTSQAQGTASSGTFSSLSSLSLSKRTPRSPRPSPLTPALYLFDGLNASQAQGIARYAWSLNLSRGSATGIGSLWLTEAGIAPYAFSLTLSRRERGFCFLLGIAYLKIPPGRHSRESGNPEDAYRLPQGHPPSSPRRKPGPRGKVSSGFRLSPE